jgi:hypothetical protein
MTQRHPRLAPCAGGCGVGTAARGGDVRAGAAERSGVCVGSGRDRAGPGCAGRGETALCLAVVRLAQTSRYLQPLRRREYSSCGRPMSWRAFLGVRIFLRGTCSASKVGEILGSRRPTRATQECTLSSDFCDGSEVVMLHRGGDEWLGPAD